ncbi:MAG: hypothetical protein H7327_06745, partial [Herminiimonas sp.]|nr:hypothetical protein [Herminiimonas sp.]
MTVPSVVQPPVNQRVPTSPPGPASATQKPATPHNAGGIFDKAKKALKDHIAGWVGGQEATPTHTPTKGPSLEQKNALRLLPPEDRLALLIEIRDGHKNVPEQRRKLQKAVKAHIRMQLDPTDEISPGLFATGFDHVRHIKSVDAVIPDGWFPRGDEILITEIVNASIEHLSKNDASTPPPANAISFEQIIEGTKPTSNPEAQSLSAPICGVDGIGNRVV